MKKLLLIISWLCFAQGFAYAQKMISLWDASQSDLIKVYACWNTKYPTVYGHNLFLRVTNLQKQKMTIIVRPGETTFLSHNPGYQNQMVVKVDTMIIAASATDSILLYSNCIGHAKQCPGYGNEFSLIAQTDVDLQNMAEYISQNGYYGTSTAQSAVWTVQRSTPITDIYATDTVMARRLADRAAELTGQAAPVYIPRREHHIVVVNGNFNYQAVKPVTVTVGVYDTTGKPINILMEKKQLPTGYHTFNYHANEVAPVGTKYIIKMTNDKGEILYSKSLSEEAESSETFNQKIICPFTLDKSYKDQMLGVYDSKGNLMAEIFRYRPWTPGTYNLNYTLFHNRKDDSLFYLQLRGKDNKVSWQKAIRKKQEGDDKYPEETMDIQLKYPISVKTEQTKCVIYSEFGDEIATVFKDKKLNAGPNEIKYKLKHTYGKNARFTLQVLGSTGQILFVKELKQQ